VDTDSSSLVSRYGNVLNMAMSHDGERLIVLGDSDGEHMGSFEVDQTTGSLDDAGVYTGIDAVPAAIVTHPADDLLYIAYGFDGSVNGHTEAFSVSSGGAFTSLGATVFNDANSDPVFAAIAPDGSILFVSDEQYSQVAPLPIQSNGGLGAYVEREDLSEGRGFAIVHPNADYLYVTEYDVDTLWAFKIGSSGALTSVSGYPKEVSGGPGAMAMNADGSLLFVTLLDTGKVRVYSVDGDTGKLTEVSGSPFDGGRSPVAAAVFEPKP
jgi:6-phosphogluconolactonase (cycloisomerase 2 family)